MAKRRKRRKGITTKAGTCRWGKVTRGKRKGRCRTQRKTPKKR